eukprot:jgi/Undpi1/12502/HiC_scaffold_5.g02173.m1
MTVSKMKLVGALSALSVGSVMGQTSCVQVNSTAFASCPCVDASLTFTLEGETTVAANTVNLALVLDGSGSVSSSEFLSEQQFAVDTVAAFAARNLFDNGGMASYVQYSTFLIWSGTGQGTNTHIGINEGTALLTATDATASFMIVITDGQTDAARAEGIVVFAVGVGTGTGDDELLAIAGDANNVFHVAEFDLLDAALENILSSSGGTVIDCPSTGASVTIEFGVPIDSTASGSFSGSTVTFSASDLESTPTDFDVLLDVCGEVPGGSIVVSATYTDDQGNDPDLSALTGLVVGTDFCEAPTPSPTLSPTPSPTMPPTPCPTMKEPKRGNRLKKGSAKKAKYLGCYKDGSRHNPLSGYRFSSPHMTAQPTKKAGTCDYECAGDKSRACGGVNCMSVYKFRTYHGHH